MGNTQGPRRSCTCMVIGLDNSGKSSIVSHLKTEPLDADLESPYIHPTAGLELNVIRSRDSLYYVWDMSGFGKYREMWEGLYGQVQGIVFVVDAIDYERFGIVVQEWNRLFENYHVKRTKLPILLMLNKTDTEVDNSSLKLNNSTIEHMLSLDTFRQGGRQIKVVSCSGISGANVHDGFSWLATVVNSYK